MTTLTDLPTAITEYFALLNGADKRATIDVFTPDAVVTDDGKTYRGLVEILDWLGTAASEYTVTTTRLSAESSGDTVTVTTRLEGNFPGGIVDLRNIFTLDGSGLISGVVITV
jgi:ketosteroid isomerase-like protein